MTPGEKQAVLLELAERKHVRDTLVGELHEAQRKVYDDPAQYRAVVASRRGGKTYLDATLLTLALQDSPRGVWSVFIAPTGPLGKDLIWADMVRMNERFNLGWAMKEHPTPYIRTKVGAEFRIIGMDDRVMVDRLRGKKYALVVVDEAKDLSAHLAPLVDSVIGPALMGVGGRMVIGGTPGRICNPNEYWYAINHGLKPGWSAHHWTLHANKTFIKDPEKELARVRELKDWSESHAVYQREYLGIWASSDDERVYSYIAGRNSVPALPAHYVKNDQGVDPRWTHVIGIDMGYDPDPTAWICLASHPKEKDVYVVHAETKQKQLPDEVAAKTKQLIEKFRPSRVVGDSGGMGKSYTEEWNRRWSQVTNTWIHGAQKRNKRDNQELMNEEMKAGRVKVCLSEANELAVEWQNLGWKDSWREQEDPNSPNHLCDAALYAFMDHRAYYNQPDPPPLTPEEQQVADRRARAKAAQARQTKGLLR